MRDIILTDTKYFITELCRWLMGWIVYMTHGGRRSISLFMLTYVWTILILAVKLRPKGLKALSRKDLSYFINAYEKMIYQIKKNYPNGKIVCGTLMRTSIPTNDSWVFPEYFGDVSFEDYNDAIREASRRQKCCLADTDALNMRYETLDGSHPTVSGHRTLADAWRRCLVSIGLV